jgi:DNA-binding transcriptional LysR family regulator
MAQATFRQLQTFVLVAETGSFARAADRLGVSPAAISGQVSALGQKLGRELFARRPGTTPVLSAHGAALLEEARGLVERAAALAGPAGGGLKAAPRVRVGAGDFILERVFLPSMARLQLAHPEAQVELVRINPDLVLEAMDKQRLDLAYVSTMREDLGPSAQRIGQVRLGLFAAPGLGLSDRLKMVMPLPGTGLERAVRAALAGAGLADYEVVTHAQHTRTMLELAAEGTGACCVFEEDAAEDVGAGRFETRAVVGRHSVLRPLAEAFNAMTQHVASLLQSHRTLTSAVSHELRTPIARLRFSHSLAREEPGAEGKDRFLARMERDIAEIDELTTELLDYAKLERGAPGLSLQSVPAEPWLEDVLADARADDELRGRSVEIRSDVALEAMSCEPRYMARAVINLLRNALLHARSTVRVTLHREDNRTVIDVDDDGAGISPADRERLFEPFERLDRNRGRESGGFGLGLAIVRQVARWHGGDARITDSPLGGTRVSIAW